MTEGTAHISPRADSLLAGGFEAISKYVTPDLVYTVEVELLKSKVGGQESLTPRRTRGGLGPLPEHAGGCGSAVVGGRVGRRAQRTADRVEHAGGALGRFAVDDRPEPDAKLGLPGGRGSRLGEQPGGCWMGPPERKGVDADRSRGRVHLNRGGESEPHLDHERAPGDHSAAEQSRSKAVPLQQPAERAEPNPRLGRSSYCGIPPTGDSVVSCTSPIRIVGSAAGGIIGSTATVSLGTTREPDGSEDDFPHECGEQCRGESITLQFADSAGVIHFVAGSSAWDQEERFLARETERSSTSPSGG